MKVFYISTALALIVGCGTSKTVEEVSTTTEKTEVTEKPEKTHTGAHINIEGVVRDKSDGEEGGGCTFVILVEIDGKKMVLDPDTLPTKYQKDGAEVVISFDYSRRVSKCVDAMPVILSEIEDR